MNAAARTGRSRSAALLVLANGEEYEAESAGAVIPGGVATGELVFQTAMSGYQEVLSDPSYAGQVVAFTAPHIGNYGTNAADDEAPRPACQGAVFRELCVTPSSWRSEEGLEEFLVRHGIPAVTGVDTRRLTRALRDQGATPCAFGDAEPDVLRVAAREALLTDGRDLVAGVTTSTPYRRGEGPFRVVAFDFGVKETMLAQLTEFCTLEVVPASTSAADVLALTPDGVFLSNGPGDPAALPGPVSVIADLLGKVPIFGICLGHQLLATALGGVTYKLPFGHHGANHPVQRVASGQVEITSQNHNYAVADIPNAVITHVNLNDGVIEGFRHETSGAFSVQYHPEAGPGPHDARYLFSEFAAAMGSPGSPLGTRSGTGPR